MTPSQQALSIRHDAEEAAALFPALLIDAERIAQTVAAGLHGRRRAGPGETFWQHRPYAFGDPVSAIDWRQSARAADRLYIRQNEWEAAAAVYLWRDPSRSLDYASSKNLPSKARRADVIATALAILLAEAGERIGLLGQDRRPFQGRNAPARILEALIAQSLQAKSLQAKSSQEPDADHSAPPMTHVTRGARIVLLSDFFTEPERVEAAALAYANEGAVGALVQICDPAEEAFPFEGRIEFRDMESADRLIFGETGSMRRAYQEKFNAHREALETLARKTGWTFMVHHTDHPAQTALLSLFTALGDARLWNA